MKRGATREDIIRATEALIVRRGIRAVRVDEIAQRLGISKRTLYETFADKNDLVNTCLEDLHRQRERKIATYLCSRSHSPLHKVAWLLQKYTEQLRATDSRFLIELRQRHAHSAYCEQDRRFWERNIAEALKRCKEQGDVLPDLECTRVASRLMRALYEMRLTEVPQEEQRLICRTCLRGIATEQGIRKIDRRNGA